MRVFAIAAVRDRFAHKEAAGADQNLPGKCRSPGHAAQSAGEPGAFGTGEASG